MITSPLSASHSTPLIISSVVHDHQTWATRLNPYRLLFSSFRFAAAFLTICRVLLPSANHPSKRLLLRKKPSQQQWILRNAATNRQPRVPANRLAILRRRQIGIRVLDRRTTPLLVMVKDSLRASSPPIPFDGGPKVATVRLHLTLAYTYYIEPNYLLTELVSSRHHCKYL